MKLQDCIDAAKLMTDPKVKPGSITWIRSANVFRDMGYVEIGSLMIQADSELARLRERVAELETGISQALERLEAVISSQVESQYFIEAARARERLLMETVRWCLENGVLLDSGNLFEYDSEGGRYTSRPPTHLAPLIAEAVECEEK